MKFKITDYSTWSRQIAKTKSAIEIEKEIKKLEGNRKKLSQSHLNAIKKTTSMTSNSQRRAQSRAIMTGNYEKLQAYKNALEILNTFNFGEI
jgi:hypothetical protein